MSNIWKSLKKNKYLSKIYKNASNIKMVMRHRKLIKNNNAYLRSNSQIKAMKGKHAGRRCFIIGNGPSLSIKDLARLENEDTFAMNKIYKVFKETNWRPTYYFCQDIRVIEEIYKDQSIDMDNISAQMRFFPIDVKWQGIKYSDKNSYFYLKRKYITNKNIEFSDDVSLYCGEGSTVTYSAIQFAVYFGYNEIYLIGVDHNYSKLINEDGTVTVNQKVRDYFSKEYTYKHSEPVDLRTSTRAYEKANEYCKKREIIIKNATRGGKLEAFDRIDLDELL